MEEGQKRFEEIGEAPDVKPLAPITTVQLPKKPKRKTVKGLVPKSK
jgi:hypothetical protein